MCEQNLQTKNDIGLETLNYISEALIFFRALFRWAETKWNEYENLNVNFMQMPVNTFVLPFSIIRRISRSVFYW